MIRLNHKRLNHKQAFYILILLLSLVFAIGEVNASKIDQSIKVAQEQLAVIGYDPGGADGYFGKKTKISLEYFQEDFELTITGLLNEETKAKLNVVSQFYEAIENDNVQKIRKIASKELLNSNIRGIVTPLNIAATTGRDKLLSVLLECGADANGSNNKGETALMRAIFGEYKKLAPTERYHNIYQTLIASGANVNATDINVQSALFYTIHFGNLLATKLLINAGADINTKNDIGVAPLMLAIEDKYYDVAKELINRGSDANVSSQDGHTPLMSAAHEGRADMVKLLIDNDANVNQIKNDGLSALIFAAIKDHKAVVKTLADAGADINHQDNDGWSALMYTAAQGHINTLQMLLKYNADTGLRNKDGMSAISIAKKRGNRKIEEILTKDN